VAHLKVTSDTVALVAHLELDSDMSHSALEGAICGVCDEVHSAVTRMAEWNL